MYSYQHTQFLKIEDLVRRTHRVRVDEMVALIKQDFYSRARAERSKRSLSAKNKNPRPCSFCGISTTTYCMKYDTAYCSDKCRKKANKENHNKRKIKELKRRIEEIETLIEDERSNT